MMAQRSFGMSGRNVSELGLGTVKFGRNQNVRYPGGDGFALPSDTEIQSLLDLCTQNGITLLDTAPAYGTSEERLGSLMGSRREKFFLVTKTGEEFADGNSEYIFTAAHTRMSVERSLKRLRTDHIDCVLVHCSRDDVKVLGDTPVIETLAALKREGKIGAIGASTYTVAGGKLAADLTDCVMVSYNASYTEESAVIDYAAEKGKAVLIKKGLASGHISTPEALKKNIRFVLDRKGVTALVFGSISRSNILSNITAAA
jgi:aryl-alcohol dehydrogenase-like predicted oxidoreductase